MPIWGVTCISALAQSGWLRHLPGAALKYIVSGAGLTSLLWIITMTCSPFFYLTFISEAIMPGERANSEPIIPSEDAPTEGFNMGKYLVRRSMSEAWHLKTDLNTTVKIKIIILRFLCQPLFLTIQIISVLSPTSLIKNSKSKSKYRKGSTTLTTRCHEIRRCLFNLWGRGHNCRWIYQVYKTWLVKAMSQF